MPRNKKKRPEACMIEVIMSVTACNQQRVTLDSRGGIHEPDVMRLEFVPGPGYSNRRVESANTRHTPRLQARCSSSRARWIKQSLDNKNCTAENKGDPSSGERMTLGQEGSTFVDTSSHVAVPSCRFHLKGRLP